MISRDINLLNFPDHPHTHTVIGINIYYARLAQIKPRTRRSRAGRGAIRQSVGNHRLDRQKNIRSQEF